MPHVRLLGPDDHRRPWMARLQAAGIPVRDEDGACALLVVGPPDEMQSICGRARSEGAGSPVLAILGPGVDPLPLRELVDDFVRHDAPLVEVVARLRWLGAGHSPARARRRRDRERFELLARAMSDAIWDLDIPTGAIEWSFGLGTQYGYEPSEAGDLDWWRRNIHPDDAERVTKGIDQAIAEHESWEDEYRFRHADGSWRYTRDRGVLLRDAEGQAVRMVGAMTDVTDQILLETRLQAADRMATVGALAAGVAHEINNPLVYVIGNLETARESLDDPAARAQVEASLDQAIEGTSRIAAIARDLRAFARPDQGERGPVDLRRVLQAAIGMAQNEIRHRATLSRRLDPVPPVLGREGRLGQVFLNLLLNAAQSIPAGEPDRHRIDVRLRAVGSQQVVVEVQDTGSGVPGELKEQVFVPFFTTKAGVGLGLGLAISREIARSHGGDIELEDAPGGGALFRVVLPTLPIPETPPAPAPPDPTPGEVRRRILAIDDEAAILQMIEQVLGRVHEVVTEARAEAALERLRAGERFDLVLCDLMMPGMTGMAFHQALAQVAPEQIEGVVFLTGGAFTHEARDFLASNNRPVLEKPFRIARLRELVRRGPPWGRR